MTRRAHGIPAVRGPLRTFRVCECAGEGCYGCHGAGRVLVAEISSTQADLEARHIVRDHQSKGLWGRDM